jgi:hypothetical protein
MINTLLISVLIIVVVILIPNNTFSQSATENTNNEKIVAHTDKKSYVAGEAVIVSGRVNPVVRGERVRIDVFDPKGGIFGDNIGVAYFKNDGTFSTFSDNGFIAYNHLMLSKNSIETSGIYRIVITYDSAMKVIPISVIQDS